MIYFNNRNGSSGLIRRLILPGLISATAIHGRWNRSLCWKGRCYPTIHLMASSFFLIINTRSSLLDEIRWAVCISKCQKLLCVSFSTKDSGLYIFHLLIWWNFDLLHNSQWIPFPTQSRLVSYFFRASLMHSFIMWLTVSAMSLHNLHFLFSSVLSIFA